MYALGLLGTAMYRVLVGLFMFSLVAHSLTLISLRGSLLELDLSKPRLLSNISIPESLFHPLEKDYSLLLTVDGLDYRVSVPGCLLQSARFQETLTLHLDSQDRVYHVDYAVPASECSGIVKPKSKKFKTTIVGSKAIPGARPILQPMPETKDGQPPVQTSFLVKYWYYILPIVIVMLLPVGEEPAQRAAPKRSS